MGLLARIFIKDYKNIDDINVRNKYGVMCGIVGVITNAFICIFKILIGMLTLSIIIVADGINNLTDAFSSVVTLVGFRLASKEANKRHPFGYERMEYITGLIISFMIVVIGGLLFRESIGKLISPVALVFDNEGTNYLLFTIIILSVSILFKFFLFIYYRRIGKFINSVTLKASSQDSLNDIISTTVVLIVMILSKITGNLYIDGIFGLVVSVYIIFNGIILLKDTVSPLIGEKPDKDFIKYVVEKIKGYDVVLGIHDLVIHSYGPKKKFITCHVEVDGSSDINDTHEKIDLIERDFLDNDHINLVIHMDPVDTKDLDKVFLEKEVGKIINEYDDKLKFHDFRIVKGTTRTIMIFDVVKNMDSKATDLEIENYIKEKVKEIKYINELDVVITFDIDYLGGD